MDQYHCCPPAAGRVLLTKELISEKLFFTLIWCMAVSVNKSPIIHVKYALSGVMDWFWQRWGLSLRFSLMHKHKTNLAPHLYNHSAQQLLSLWPWKLILTPCCSYKHPDRFFHLIKEQNNHRGRKYPLSQRGNTVITKSVNLIRN